MEYKTSEEYRSQPLKGLNNSSGQFGSKVLRGHQKDGPVTDEEYNNVKSDRRLKTATMLPFLRGTILLCQQAVGPIR